MRRFIKGDDNMINQFLFHLRENKEEIGIVNSIARWDGFRLADLVSYDRKHNEENGENNQDGMDYNCSWNCGVEGRSRKRHSGTPPAADEKRNYDSLYVTRDAASLQRG